MPQPWMQITPNISKTPPDCACIATHTQLLRNFRVLKRRRGVSNLPTNPELPDATPGELEGGNMLEMKLRSTSTTSETHRTCHGSSNLQFRDFVPHHDDNPTRPPPQPKPATPTPEPKEQTRGTRNKRPSIFARSTRQGGAHLVRKGSISLFPEGRPSPWCL